MQRLLQEAAVEKRLNAFSLKEAGCVVWSRARGGERSSTFLGSTTIFVPSLSPTPSVPWLYMALSQAVRPNASQTSCKENPAEHRAAYSVNSLFAWAFWSIPGFSLLVSSCAAFCIHSFVLTYQADGRESRALRWRGQEERDGRSREQINTTKSF